MALDRFLSGGEQSEFSSTSRAANHCLINNNDPTEICDNVYDFLPTNVLQYDYLDFNNSDFDSNRIIS